MGEQSEVIELAEGDLIKILATKILLKANTASHNQSVFVIQLDIEEFKKYAKVMEGPDAQ